MYVSLVESLEKNGKRYGENKYFWTFIKNNYFDLQKVLNKVRLYRHSTEHISLDERYKPVYFSYLDEDLNGSNPFFVQDGYEKIQQKILLEIEDKLESLLCVEKNRKD